MKIHSDVKQHASAKQNTTIVHGRAEAKTIHSVLNANCISAAADGRAMLGLGRRPIRIKTVRFYIATARLLSAEVFGILPFSE